MLQRRPRKAVESGQQGVGLLQRATHHVHVERAGQATLAGDGHQEVNLVPAGAGQQLGRRGRPRPRRTQGSEHPLHALGIGAGRLGLGPPALSRLEAA